MFVLSFKASRIKLITAGVTTAVLLIAAVYALSSASSAQAGTKPAKPKEISDNSQRVLFIKEFGYEVTENPVEVAEVVVPTEFDDVYTEYNNIQKKQGYDLMAYRGKRVKRYTYEVTNYPGHPQNVRADILVSNGKIIGGNVCSIEADGFMHGFKREDM